MDLKRRSLEELIRSAQRFSMQGKQIGVRAFSHILIGQGNTILQYSVQAFRQLFI